MAYFNPTMILTNYVTYVFGNEIFAALGFLFILALIGIRYNYGLESFIIVFSPTILILLDTVFISTGIPQIMLIGIGLLIGFGLLAIIRR